MAVTAPQWTIGDRMRKARIAAGLEQDEMARRLETTRASVSAWERNASRPRNFMEILTRWAEETQVPLSWLLGIGDEGSSATTYKQHFEYTQLPLVALVRDTPT